MVGLLMLPLAIGQTATGPRAGVLSRRVPARLVYAVALVLVAGGVGLLAATSGSLLAALGGALLLGIGAGGALQAGSAVATEAVAQDVAGVSASLNSTVRRLAGGVGGQVATIVLAAIALGPRQPSFPAFTVSYLVSAGLCVLGAGCLLLAPSRQPLRR
jgi:MFS family permease